HKTTAILFEATPIPGLTACGPSPVEMHRQAEHPSAAVLQSESVLPGCDSPRQSPVRSSVPALEWVYWFLAFEQNRFLGPARRRRPLPDDGPSDARRCTCCDDTGPPRDFEDTPVRPTPVLSTILRVDRARPRDHRAGH